MKKQRNGYDIIRQNDETVTRSHKHEVNLQKNSTLYFQIGLIVCLLMTFGLLEMRFDTRTPTVNPLTIEDDTFDYNLAQNFIVEPNVKPEKQPKKKTIQAPVFKQISDDVDMKVAAKKVVDLDSQGNPETPDFTGLKEKPEDVLIPINIVQKVPVFPGCEKETTNDGRRNCMSEKIQKIITKNFNRDLAEDLSLSGIQRINVMFRIDKSGHVSKIEARAPHATLEKEAIRVIELIPEMTPGKMQDRNVEVGYALPIVFQVRN